VQQARKKSSLARGRKILSLSEEELLTATRKTRKKPGRPGGLHFTGNWGDAHEESIGRRKRQRTLSKGRGPKTNGDKGDYLGRKPVKLRRELVG